MSNYIGGDVTDLACTHPTLGTYRFAAKANEDFTLNKGGLRNNDDANGITGSGQAIWQINRTRWSFEGPVAVDMISDNEMAGLDLLSSSPLEGTWTLTTISGAIYKGKGKPVGDLNTASNTAQLTLKIAGSGQLQKLP